MSIVHCIMVLLAACALTIGGEKLSSTNTTRIIGGYNAEKPIPYQISLQVRVKKPLFAIPFLTSNKEWAHNCGGSIISERHVLTAAHCVDQADPNSLSVLVGTPKRSDGGTRYMVDSYAIHPDYDPLYTGDIAIMTMKSPFKMTRLVQAIELNEDEIGGKVPCKLSGWGYTRSITIGSLPEYLQTIDLVTITNDECQSEGFNVTEGEICTYKGYLQGACAGDSGGPLVNAERSKQIGIVSYGTSICSIGLPDAFTRVSNYVPWIREQIAKKDDPAQNHSIAISTESTTSSDKELSGRTEDLRH